LAHKTANDCIYLSSACLHRHNAYIYGKFKFRDPEYQICVATHYLRTPDLDTTKVFCLAKIFCTTADLRFATTMWCGRTRSDLCEKMQTPCWVSWRTEGTRAYF